MAKQRLVPGRSPRPAAAESTQEKPNQRATLHNKTYDTKHAHAKPTPGYCSQAADDAPTRRKPESLII